MLDPTTTTYKTYVPGDAGYPIVTPQVIVICAAVISVMALVSTLFVVYFSWSTKDPFPLYMTIGIWAVGPPIWFWWEYFYVYRIHGNPDTLELFKYGQDVAKAIWAGVLAALIALAASDILEPSGSCFAL